MKEFYSVLNSDLTESTVDKFKMDKFIPIPKILFDEDLEYGFSPKSYLKISINGKDVRIRVDSKGRTQDEFNDLISSAGEEHGTCSLKEWCKKNWGCKEELEVTNIISCDENVYCVKYECVWTPNIAFVKNLHRLYPTLRITLEYVRAEELVSRTLKFFRDDVTFESHFYKNVCFKKLKDTDKFLFVSDSEEADSFSIDIIGADWIKSLEEDGFTYKNVENWYEVMLYLK